MFIREVRPEEKNQFNAVASHPLQLWQWGDFREKTGVEVLRLGMYEGNELKVGYQLTLHPLPKLPFMIGYLPKSPLPTQEVLDALREFGQRKQIIHIKMEPNVYTHSLNFNQDPRMQNYTQQLMAEGCVLGKPLFTKYSFMLDLAQSESDLLAKMKPKTRYNISVATKKGVTVSEDNSSEAFEQYLKLTFETTKRQGFYAHNEQYHRQMWETLYNARIAHLLTAKFEGQILVAWVLFVCNGALYYPYGASSSQQRNLMASNLMMWEAIRFGKRMGCSKFDMWGSLRPDPDPKDPWLGFHRFKEGYGPNLMEFLGSFDFVINQPMYQIYNLTDSMRWKYLKIRAKLPF